MITDFDANRKPVYDFLLVINTHLYPESHFFSSVIAQYITAFDKGYLVLDNLCEIANN